MLITINNYYREPLVDVHDIKSTSFASGDEIHVPDTKAQNNSQTDSESAYLSHNQLLDVKSLNRDRNPADPPLAKSNVLVQEKNLNQKFSSHQQQKSKSTDRNPIISAAPSFSEQINFTSTPSHSRANLRTNNSHSSKKLAVGNTHIPQKVKAINSARGRSDGNTSSIANLQRSPSYYNSYPTSRLP